MENEKRLIDANELMDVLKENHDNIMQDPEVKSNVKWREAVVFHSVSQAVRHAPTVDAVPVEQYKALIEMYHELRENFIDYYCSGIPIISPYCLNRCEECVDTFGWCKYTSDKCRGFNPAEVIIYDERRTDESSGDSTV